jgi:hypothetical protein
MEQAVSIARLMHQIELGFDLIVARQLRLTSVERDALSELYQQLAVARSDIQHTRRSELLEGKAYSLFERHPRLRKLYGAAGHAAIVEFCNLELKRFSQRAQRRSLSPEELKERDMAEAALARVKEDMDKALESF